MSADEWDKVICIVCFILGFIYFSVLLNGGLTLWAQ